MALDAAFKARDIREVLDATHMRAATLRSSTTSPATKS